MAQIIKVYKPIYVNTDGDARTLKGIESPFIKNHRTDANRNSDNANHSGNGTRSGSNQNIGTPLLANIEVDDTVLPEGFNLTCGSAEFEQVNELYKFVYNDAGNHGIYVLDGSTMTWSTVKVDPLLNFSKDPKYKIAEHRCALVVIYNDDQEGQLQVYEKFLIFTEGNNWQRWINVRSAIATNGFDETQFPYWKTFAPHYDRAAMIDYAPRPPMFCPTTKLIPFNPETDTGKNNALLNTSYQFAYRVVYTDGRKSTLSPYSNPVVTLIDVCNPANLNIPRCVNITLDAGGPMVEYIELYQRQSYLGDWVLYDTLNKFTTCGANDPTIIGSDYWTRTNPWSAYNYDPVTNKIVYKWCGDKVYTIVDQVEISQYQTGLPIKSIALANLGDAIGFGNNLYDYPNSDCDTAACFDVQLTPGEGGQACDTELVTIKFYAYLGSDYRPMWRNQFAWSDGPYTTTDPPDVYFGGVTQQHVAKALKGVFGGWTETGFDKDQSINMGLNFNKREGPVAYLAGTDYWAIGRQMKIARGASPDSRGDYVGPINVKDDNAINSATEDVSLGAIYYFEWEFKVPKGIYVARLARHDVDINVKYQATSTYVMGIMDSRIRSQYSAEHQRDDLYINWTYAKVSDHKEFVIDATAGDVDLWQKGADMFCIFCPYNFEIENNVSALSDRRIRENRWSCNEGYVYEDATYKVPVELLTYNSTAGSNDYKVNGVPTDHNGFYFAYSSRGNARDARVAFQGQINCNKNNGTDLFYSPTGSPYNGYVWYNDNRHVSADIYITGTNGLIYRPYTRVEIRGKVVDCKNGFGVGNIAVTLTRGAFTLSGSDGSFVLYAHPATAGIRQDDLVINGNACQFAGCGCSKVPMIHYQDGTVVSAGGLQPCVVCNDPNCPPRVYQLPADIQIAVQNQSVHSLKGGGHYGIAFAEADIAGRATFPTMIKYIDYPTFMESGTFEPFILNWLTKCTPKFHKDTKYLLFYRTENLAFRSYVQWVGDSIEFIDAFGNIQQSPIGATRARIKIQSLLDFNVRENFSSTVTYQVRKGDIVRIYDNGDGKLFDPKETSGFMDYIITGSNYDQTAQELMTGQTDTSEMDPRYIYITYDSRLADLKEKCSFWIEIRRPSDQVTEQKLYEVCGTLNVVDGAIENNVVSGTLDTWDTYQQRRHIYNPVCSGKEIVHPFESASITDYWGEFMDSRGRMTVEDKKAQQLWYNDDVVRSNVLVNNGRANGLGTVLSSNRKGFKGQKMGGIVAMHAELNLVIFVCENGWMRVSYDVNYVRNTPQGLVATNLANQLDDPQQMDRNGNGCRYEDTGTIQFYGDYAFWGDANNRAFVKFNYQVAELISNADNRMYFDSKFTEMLKHNSLLSEDDYLDNLMEVFTAYDPASYELNVVFRKRNFRKQNQFDFVNLEREVKIWESENFIYSILYNKWVRWATYVPEFFGRLRKSRDGKLLIAFKEGKAFAHNSTKAVAFNTFFGIKDHSVIEVVEQDPGDEQKIYQSVAIECNDSGWHVDRVFTDERYSYSYIPPAYFKKKEHVLYAELLRDMSSYPSAEDYRNGRVMLIDGKRIMGSFMSMRIVLNESDTGNYYELANIEIRQIKSERSNK